MDVKTGSYLGDCTTELENVAANSVDLIFTSPPYADQSKNTYGDIHPGKYVNWVLLVADGLFRVLKPNGKVQFINNTAQKRYKTLAPTTAKRILKHF